MEAGADMSGACGIKFRGEAFVSLAFEHAKAKGRLLFAADDYWGRADWGISHAHHEGDDHAVSQPEEQRGDVVCPFFETSGVSQS